MTGEHVLAVDEHAAPPGSRQAVYQAVPLHFPRNPRPERRPMPIPRTQPAQPLPDTNLAQLQQYMSNNAWGMLST